MNASNWRKPNNLKQGIALIHSFTPVCHNLLRNLWFLCGSGNGDISDYITRGNKPQGNQTLKQGKTMNVRAQWVVSISWIVFINRKVGGCFSQWLNQKVFNNKTDRSDKTQGHDYETVIRLIHTRGCLIKNWLLSILPYLALSVASSLLRCPWVTQKAKFDNFDQ